jgi:hypothetical protein
LDRGIDGAAHCWRTRARLCPPGQDKENRTHAIIPLRFPATGAMNSVANLQDARHYQQGRFVYSRSWRRRCIVTRISIAKKTRMEICYLLAANMAKLV